MSQVSFCLIHLMFIFLKDLNQTNNTFQVLTVVPMKSTTIWNVTLHGLVAVYQCFRGTLLAACLHDLHFKPEYRGSVFL